MSEFPIAPTFDYVYVVRDTSDKTNEGDFYLPDSVKNRAQTGTILAIGPGYLDLLTGKFIATTLKKGDKIFLREFGGMPLTYTSASGEEWKFYLFVEKDIIGKLNE